MRIIAVIVFAAIFWTGLAAAQQSGAVSKWGSSERTTFSDGSHAVSEKWGSGTRTRFYNADGTSSGSATTSSWGSGTRTQFYNKSGSPDGSAATSASGNGRRTNFSKPINSVEKKFAAPGK